MGLANSAVFPFFLPLFLPLFISPFHKSLSNFLLLLLLLLPFLVPEAVSCRRHVFLRLLLLFLFLLSISPFPTAPNEKQKQLAIEITWRRVPDRIIHNFRGYKSTNVVQLKSLDSEILRLENCQVFSRVLSEVSLVPVPDEISRQHVSYISNKSRNN